MRTLLILVLLSIGLLFAGCLGSQPSAPAQPPANHTGQPGTNATPNATSPEPPAPQMNCTGYCMSQPHIECVGTWNISGTYPSCACGFVCDGAADGTGESPDTPAEPIATPTNLSVSELMDRGLSQEKSDFYRSNDGTYEEKTYTWLREGSGIFGGISPASDVKFNGEEIPEVLASGFIVFQAEGSSHRQAYGLAIFNTTRTFLDDFANDAFDVDYFPQIIDKKLRDCWTYSKDFNLDSQGGWLQTYYFKCERAPDK